MTTHPRPLKPFNSQQVRPRGLSFRFDAEIPRLWLRSSPIMTHLFNGTNLFLPAFEAYMVRTIQGQLKHLCHDPVLRSQAQGLIGQEVNHSQAHQPYNEILRQQGYCFETYLKGVDWFFGRLMPRLSLPIQLGAIAGFEHLTASLSEIILHHNALEPAHPTMKALWEWHAAEELEHKSIAFDLFKGLNGAYWQRVVGGMLGLAIVVVLMTTGMLLLAAQDPKFLSFKTLSDLNKLLLTEYRLVPRSLHHLMPYVHPKFHPSQRDDSQYAEQVLTPSALVLNIGSQ